MEVCSLCKCGSISFHIFIATTVTSSALDYLCVRPTCISRRWNILPRDAVDITAVLYNPLAFYLSDPNGGSRWWFMHLIVSSEFMCCVPSFILQLIVHVSLLSIHPTLGNLYPDDVQNDKQWFRDANYILQDFRLRNTHTCITLLCPLWSSLRQAMSIRSQLTTFLWQNSHLLQITVGSIIL